MKIKFTAPISASIAIGVGIVVLAGYFIPSINNIRFILLRTGLVLAAVALLVGIINLLSVHFKKMGADHENSGYSLILVIALLITLEIILIIVKNVPSGSNNHQSYIRSSKYITEACGSVFNHILFCDSPGPARFFFYSTCDTAIPS